jgi:hypothetical protein
VDEQARRRPGPAAPGQRHQLCRLEADDEVTAVISQINARGAMLRTAHRPRLGSKVRLRHLHAGAVEGKVSGHAACGIEIAFSEGARATAFALAVVASGMLRPEA